MKRRLLIVTAVFGAAAGLLSADEKKVQMKDLPPAVQKAVQEQTKGAELKGLALETEGGKTFYEAETIVNGRTRDLLFDAAGHVVEVEEAVALDAVPAPVKAAFESQGKVLKVETVTKGKTVIYEAQIEKGGKKTEVAVNANGKTVKR